MNKQGSLGQCAIKALFTFMTDDFVQLTEFRKELIQAQMAYGFEGENSGAMSINLPSPSDAKPQATVTLSGPIFGYNVLSVKRDSVAKCVLVLQKELNKWINSKRKEKR